MSSLGSFHRPVHALVVGANGALGGAFVDLLDQCPQVAHVYACSRTPTNRSSGKVTSRLIDVTDEASIASAVAGIPHIDLVLVATGRLHMPGGLQPEKTWRTLNAATLHESFAVNTVGPTLVAKHVLPLFPRSGKAVFAALSARVGSISDNRLGGWYAYRASKAALNQMVRTLAIELARNRPDGMCVALHPGTVDSALSRPFQSGVGLDKLFTPSLAAERLLTVIDGLDPTRNGELIAWDGQTIAP